MSRHNGARRAVKKIRDVGDDIYTGAHADDDILHTAYQAEYEEYKTVETASPMSFKQFCKTFGPDIDDMIHARACAAAAVAGVTDSGPSTPFAGAPVDGGDVRTLPITFINSTTENVTVTPVTTNIQYQDYASPFLMSPGSTNKFYMPSPVTIHRIHWSFNFTDKSGAEIRKPANAFIGSGMDPNTAFSLTIVRDDNSDPVESPAAAAAADQPKKKGLLKRLFTKEPEEFAVDARMTFGPNTHDGTPVIIRNNTDKSVGVKIYRSKHRSGSGAFDAIVFRLGAGAFHEAYVPIPRGDDRVTADVKIIDKVDRSVVARTAVTVYRSSPTFLELTPDRQIVSRDPFRDEEYTKARENAKSMWRRLFSGDAVQSDDGSELPTNSANPPTVGARLPIEPVVIIQDSKGTDNRGSITVILPNDTGVIIKMMIDTPARDLWEEVTMIHPGMTYTRVLPTYFRQTTWRFHFTDLSGEEVRPMAKIRTNNAPVGDVYRLKIVRGDNSAFKKRTAKQNKWWRRLFTDDSQIFSLDADHNALTTNSSMPSAFTSTIKTAGMTAAEVGAFLAKTVGEDAHSVSLVKSVIDSLERERTAAAVHSRDDHISRFANVQARAMSPAMCAVEAKNNEFVSMTESALRSALGAKGGKVASRLTVLAPMKIDPSVRAWSKTATPQQMSKYIAAHVIKSIDEKKGQVTTFSGSVFAVDAAALTHAIIKGKSSGSTRPTTAVSAPYQLQIENTAVTVLPIRAELQSLGERDVIHAAINHTDAGLKFLSRGKKMTTSSLPTIDTVFASNENWSWMKSAVDDKPGEKYVFSPTLSLGKSTSIPAAIVEFANRTDDAPETLKTISGVQGVLQKAMLLSAFPDQGPKSKAAVALLKDIAQSNASFDPRANVATWKTGPTSFPVVSGETLNVSEVTGSPDSYNISYNDRVLTTIVKGNFTVASDGVAYFPLQFFVLDVSKLFPAFKLIA